MVQRIWRASVLLLWGAASLAAADWQAVTKDELAETKPRIDPKAGAEALLWEVRVEDVDQRAYAIQLIQPSLVANLPPSAPQATLMTVLDNYLRIKVYNNAGRDNVSTIEIPYSGNNKILDIAGRTIQPDGKILELSKDAVFDGNSEFGTATVKSKKFAMPGVVPGSIIEYRWREVRPYIAGFQVLPLQLRRPSLPVRLVRYYVKPSDKMGGLACQAFNADNTPFVKEQGGFFSTTVKDVRAFKFEPYMPPEDEVASWLLIYYTNNPQQTPQQFWLTRAANDYNNSRNGIYDVNKEVRKVAQELTSDVTSPEEKLAKLYDFSRLRIVNRYGSFATVEQRTTAKDNHVPADTLNQKLGTISDIRNLFAGLAIAAGFDARPVAAPSRSRILSFNPAYPNGYFTTLAGIAVHVGEHWRLYDPASRYSPPSMLPWDRQGVFALIADPKNPVFVKTPLTAPSQSSIKSTGDFRLAEDGTLEGDAVIEYTGLEGEAKKRSAENQSEEARQNAVRNLMRRLRTAEVSDIKVENATDPDKMFTYRFHVRVPNYAQVTGKRVVFAPGVFQQGLGAKFTANDRTQEIYFQYPWSESDSVTIELPPGYSLDNADMPNSYTIENTGKYEVHAEVRGGKQLLYTRAFEFGDNGNIKFPVASYPSIKKIFDNVHNADLHTLAMKVADAGDR